MKKLDVIIVGAGAAGLAAAKKLREAGKKIVVLEARERVGGRVFTVHPPATPHAVEMGAEFIHGCPEELYGLIPGKIEGAVYRVTDRHYGVRSSRVVPLEDAWEEIAVVLEGIKKKRRDYSLADYLEKCRRGGPWQRQRAKAFVEGFDAAESAKISANSLAEVAAELRGEGTEMARFVDGYDEVIAYLAKGAADILLGTMVTHVRWRAGRAEVEAMRKGRPERWVAPAVLVTVPLGVLKAPAGAKGAILFSPPLEKKRAAWEKLEMGAVVKVTLLFDDVFWGRWRQDPRPGFVHLSPRDAFQVVWNHAPIDIPLFTAWAGGPAALNLAGADEAKLVSLALRALHRASGFSLGYLRRHLRRTFSHSWQDDPFARGAYSYVGVGGGKSQAVLARPERHTLYFAGEAIHAKENGTVHAAIASGRSAARKILKRAE